MSCSPNNPRRMWRPKFEETEKQCASCPFRDGNDKEFGEIVQRLRVKHGVDGGKPVHLFDILYARRTIKKEREFSGDFLCHLTVYDEQMNAKPLSERRQCRGATTYYRQLGEQPVPVFHDEEED